MRAKMIYAVVVLMIMFSLAPVIMLTTPVLAQVTIHVDVNDVSCVVGSGQIDPYAVVYCSIQDAIDDAIDGNIIDVAAGNYYEHDITINKSLTIQGAGKGSTIVDGQDISRVFYINQSTVDMSGMTIQNGQITDDGGGIYNNMGNVTLTSCNISSNEAYFDGGGIYNNGGSVMLTSCTVSNNEVTYDGGGIYNTPDGEVTLTDCIVSDNYELAVQITNGGGIYNEGTLEMTDCTVSGNEAQYYGGGIYNDGGNLTMTDCTITGNDADDDDGGGIYNDGGDVTMTDCTVSNNDAYGDGSGIYSGSTLNMTNCNVSDNTAESGDGGGIYNYGALTMNNCNVSRNMATDGGGIYNEDGQATLTDCTVSDNTARVGNGGGIHNYGALTMNNCTISGNKAYYDGGGIYHNTDEVTLTNCTISGNEAETRNGGGIYTGGSYYQTITSSTPDDGTYSWIIPLGYDEYSSYKVKITDTSDSSCHYYSNSYFALYDGCAITVTSPAGGENWELGSTHTISWTSSSTGGNVKIELYKGSGTLNMTNCTISKNDADKKGGGIYNDDLNTLTLRCTIVYGNMAGEDGDDIMNLSIIDDPNDESIVGDAVGYSGGDPNPLLGPLQNNGGPTTTHALSSLSPAIDACINGCTVDTDQREYPRPIDGDYDSIDDCDVGAYEYIPPTLPSPSPVPTLSQWGMIGMGILLAAALVWSVRRRWVVSTDKS